MRRNLDVNSIRPELRGKKMIAIIELLRLLVSYSMTGDQKMSRSSALSIFLIKAAEPFIQALHREASVNLSQAVIERLDGLAAIAGIDIEGGSQAAEYASQITAAIQPKPALVDNTDGDTEATQISFVGSLSSLSEEDWS